MKTHALRSPILALLSTLALASGIAAPATAYKLILHRGGVVEDKFPDNSGGALDAAAQRKVWMIEVDIRESKDGVAVMRHDPDLKLHFNDSRLVQDLTWQQLGRLRSTSGAERLITFEELVARAKKANLRLMLDTKPPHSAKFPALIESILARHGMVASCYVIGTPESRQHFLGKAPVAANLEVLKAVVARDPKEAAKYYLFEHGNVLTPDRVEWAKKHGIKVVPTVNLFHYETKNRDGTVKHDRPAIMAAAKADIERLKAGGVTEFQIDSEFMDWF
jgi:glycerophosphoryl diester phosphodiesterase